MNVSRIHRLVGAVAVAGVLTGAGAVLAAPASAAPGATGVYSAAALPWGAPLQVSCTLGGQPVTFTATSGTVHVVNQFSQDAQGVYHFTGTASLQGVNATDGTTGTVYSIVGASWYGGKGTSPQTATSVTTDEFNILDGTGKVASVHAVVKIASDGSVSGFSLGDCIPPM